LVGRVLLLTLLLILLILLSLSVSTKVVSLLWRGSAAVWRVRRSTIIIRTTSLSRARLWWRLSATAIRIAATARRRSIAVVVIRVRRRRRLWGCCCISALL
jgi:hypothetical protein